MCIVGPTSSGKSTWLKNVLIRNLISPQPSHITWCYRDWQPLYTELLQHIPNIDFVQGIQISEMDTQIPRLIVLDDLMVDVAKNFDVSNLFTVGSHHKNISVICLLQNLFYHGKESRTLSLNSHYLVLFKNPRDQLQVSCLARQMYPHNTGYFMTKYQSATSRPYGCLVIDLKQETPENKRLKSGNIFDDNFQETHKHAQPSTIVQNKTFTNSSREPQPTNSQTL